MTPLSAARTALGLLACVLLFGCAAQPRNPDPRDPWERMNRPIFNFDLTLTRKVALPINHGYTHVVPREVRTGIGNFFDNSFYPSVMVNDLLQGKFLYFLEDTGRFVFNSTAGIGGIFDPASKAGLAKRDNDFGRTLGVWGVPAGPYLVLPLLGPSDIRDGLGRIPDGYLWPINYIPNDWVHYGLYFVYLFDTNTRTLVPAYQLLESQHPFDEYALARSVYLDRREYLIHGQSTNQLEKQEQDLEKSLEDSGDEGTGNQATPSSPANQQQPPANPQSKPPTPQ
jgi:phospholipid-binding lipoprotein MlaA